MLSMLLISMWRYTSQADRRVDMYRHSLPAPSSARLPTYFLRRLSERMVCATSFNRDELMAIHLSGVSCVGEGHDEAYLDDIDIGAVPQGES